MPFDETEKITSLVTLLNQVSNSSEKSSVSLGQILKNVGSSAHGPLLIIPALIAIAPTGAVPGMSVLTGVIIIMVSVQILWSANTVWLPQKLMSKDVSRKKLIAAISNIKPYVAKVDKILKPRLTFLVEPPGIYFVSVVCILLAASMFPLALVPFAVALPATAVLLFGIGLTARDGLIILIGHFATGLVAWLTFITVTA